MRYFKINNIILFILMSIFSFYNIGLCNKKPINKTTIKHRNFEPAYSPKAAYIPKTQPNPSYTNNNCESLDPRIKNYIFSEDKIYTLRLYDKFQSHIVLAKNEEIKTISLGESYAFKINVLGNRIFIKPLEENIHTNMTIITNKRSYEFEIVVDKMSAGAYAGNIAYLIKFTYPNTNLDSRFDSK